MERSACSTYKQAWSTVSCKLGRWDGDLHRYKNILSLVVTTAMAATKFVVSISSNTGIRDYSVLCCFVFRKQHNSYCISKIHIFCLKISYKIKGAYYNLWHLIIQKKMAIIRINTSVGEKSPYTKQTANIINHN